MPNAENRQVLSDSSSSESDGGDDDDKKFKLGKSYRTIFRDFYQFSIILNFSKDQDMIVYGYTLFYVNFYRFTKNLILFVNYS